MAELLRNQEDWDETKSFYSQYYDVYGHPTKFPCMCDYEKYYRDDRRDEIIFCFFYPEDAKELLEIANEQH